MSWGQRFFDPIDIPGHEPLQTLLDAGHYISGLSKGEQAKPHWQTAAEILLLIAERGGDPMLARIAMMQALNHGRPAPATQPRRKRARAYRIVR